MAQYGSFFGGLSGGLQNGMSLENQIQAHKLQALKLEQLKQAVLDNAKQNAMRGAVALGNPPPPVTTTPSPAQPIAAPAPAPGTPSVPMTHPAAVAPIPPYKTVRGAPPTPTPVAAPAPAVPPTAPPAAQQPVLPTDKTTQKVSADVTQTFGLTPGRMHTDAVLLKKEGFSNADIGAYLAKNLPYYKLVDTENANMIHMKMMQEQQRQTQAYHEQMVKQGQERIDAMKQGANPIDPITLDVLSKRYENGESLRDIYPGYGKQGVAGREQILENTTQMMKKDHPHWSNQKIANYLSNQQAIYQASRYSVKQLDMKLGATRQSVMQLDKNIANTKGALKKLPGINISPILNALVRGSQKWTGNPNYGPLFYYLRGAAIEAARIRMGAQASIAQLHAGAIDEAKEWLDKNMTPASIVSTLKAIKNEGNQTVETYQRAIKLQQVGTSTSASTSSSATVRVKNPSGQIGTIPRSQLKDALKQGYVEVK